jgi:hypothetical protein
MKLPVRVEQSRSGVAANFDLIAAALKGTAATETPLMLNPSAALCFLL